MLKVSDRAADKADTIEKARRVVVLRANWDTQEKLREWAKAEGFDLGWSFSGWPQSSYDFDFHVTLVASENEVRIEDGVRWVDPVTVEPKGYAVLGETTPALVLKPSDTLTKMREFFIAAFGVTPTYPDFKPHISLSYKWSGEPSITESAPAFPPFPLVFDMLMVARLDDKASTSKDATGVTHKAMAAADRATISGTRRTKDGYLVTDARVARGGNIQDYYGHEIGEGEPNQLFKVWRPEDEIFRADSLATFAHKPVTFGHPSVEVTPETWRQDAIGHVGSEVVRDGEFVRVPLVVMDASAITAIEDGTREISMGYDCDLVMQAGVTPDGRAYDAYQKNIRINHCAVVPAGRAGPQCRIGDSAQRKPQANRGGPMKTVTIDGKQIEVADDVAAALLKGTFADMFSAVNKSLGDATASLSAANKRAEDAEKALADEKAKREAAEKAVPTADQIAKMAADLSITIDAAKGIAPKIETAGKTADAIKREAVVARLGDDAVKDRSADYISATFDLLAKSAKDADPVAAALRSGAGNMQDAGKKASDAYDAWQRDAWKGAAK